MVRHSVNNNISTSLVIFPCPNSNHLISLIPPGASNFRHLLSCGTIVSLRSCFESDMGHEDFRNSVAISSADSNHLISRNTISISE